MDFSLSLKSTRISVSGRTQVSMTRVSSMVSVLVDIAALFQDELHHVADVFVGDHDEDVHDGLADFLRCPAGPGRSVGLSTIISLAVGLADLIDDGRIGGDDVHVELAAEALLDDFHVEQAEESAAETEAERGRALGMEKVKAASLICSLPMAALSAS